MHSGLDRPEWKSGSCRHLGQREPEIVVEDHNGALLNGEPSESALELVPVLDSGVVVGAVFSLDGQEANLSRPTPALPGLGIAGIDENSVEPGLEALGIPQGAKFAPGGQQRRLDGVVSKVEVAQDPERDRHASVAGQASKRIEGFAIASLRLLY
jgi:hypothetical protein